MSLKAMLWVLEHSTTTLGSRLVLLAIAESADDEGLNAFPKIDVLCMKARMSRSQVFRCLAQLKDAGEIEQSGLTRRGVPVYRMPKMIASLKGVAICDPSDIATSHPATSGVASCDLLNYEPSFNRPKKKTPSEPSSRRGSNNDRPEITRLCDLLAKLMLGNDPKAKVAPESAAWRDACRLLIDRDGRSPDEIADVINFCQGDDFERAVVLSMGKLRTRFTELALKAQRPGTRRAMLVPGARRLPAIVEACSSDELPTEITEAWGPMRSQMAEHVDESTFDVWLTDLHPHRLDGNTLILATSVQLAGWVNERFDKFLAGIAGRPVRVIGCNTSTRSAAA